MKSKTLILITGENAHLKTKSADAIRNSKFVNLNNSIYTKKSKQELGNSPEVALKLLKHRLKIHPDTEYVIMLVRDMPRRRSTGGGYFGHEYISLITGNIFFKTCIHISLTPSADKLKTLDVFEVHMNKVNSKMLCKCPIVYRKEFEYVEEDKIQDKLNSIVDYVNECLDR